MEEEPITSQADHATDARAVDGNKETGGRVAMTKCTCRMGVKCTSRAWEEDSEDNSSVEALVGTKEA
jgi:hypothetical protein